MRYKFKQKNKKALFSPVNQGDEKWSKMACTLFAPAINIKYNIWKVISERQISEIAIKQHKKDLFDYEKWGHWRDWVNALLEGRDYNLAIFGKNDTKQLLEWIERGYMAIIWIKVNEDFYDDTADWVMNNYTDYAKYKWNIWHFTNIVKWKCRFDTKWCTDLDKEMIIDSYAFNKRNREWIYKCNIEDVLSSFSMNTKYIIY